MREKNVKPFAVEYFKEKMSEPAKWVADDDIWQKAKTAANKSYDPSDDFYWQAVTDIYKNMGGTIKK